MLIHILYVCISAERLGQVYAFYPNILSFLALHGHTP
jgi:hypothetical protein